MQLGTIDHVKHMHVWSMKIVTFLKKMDGMQGQPKGGFEFAKAALPDRKNRFARGKRAD